MNIIKWESWNAIEEDMIEVKTAMYKNILASLSTPASQDEIEDYDYQEEPSVVNINTNTPLFTPFGLHSSQSPFKPSCRWSCWMGHTTFDITAEVQDLLDEFPGIEALAVIGRYTFCVGIGKAFETSAVKKSIEDYFSSGDEDGEFRGSLE